MAEDTGTVTITEPKKIKGVALVDFPARGVLAAVQVSEHSY